MLPVRVGRLGFTRQVDPADQGGEYGHGRLNLVKIEDLTGSVAVALRQVKIELVQFVLDHPLFGQQFRGRLPRLVRGLVVRCGVPHELIELAEAGKESRFLRLLSGWAAEAGGEIVQCAAPQALLKTLPGKPGLTVAGQHAGKQRTRRSLGGDRRAVKA